MHGIKNRYIKEIAEIFSNYGTELYYVGGCVRDYMMGINSSDQDICLIGKMTRKEIHDLLEELVIQGKISNFTSVFGLFPIWIVTISNEKYEFAMGRSERSNGINHTDFSVNTKNITIEEDLLRRDLTINAIAMHVITSKIIDPYNGINHIDIKKAAHVSSAFQEDPLRVIRTARFIGKYNLKPTNQLVEMCKQMKPGNISLERVGIELKKFFSCKGDAFLFFEFLNNVNWLSFYFPELYKLKFVKQSPVYHPEGNAYIHTLYCINACNDTDWFTKTVMLCHDLGKAVTTEIKDGKITAIGHEIESAKISKDFLRRIYFDSNKNINKISILVKNHMIRNPNEKLIRRTLRELLNNKLEYSQLVEVVRCDLAGRPPKLPQEPEIGQDFANNLLLNNEMVPIVTGSLLIENHMKPNEKMGIIIKKALELQDRGTLKTHNWRNVLKSCGFKIPV